MNQFKKLLAVFTLIVAVGTLVAGLCVNEEEIDLTKVPETVLKATENAMPGIKITEAEIEKSKDGIVYELNGTLDGKEYEIEISADGKIVKIKNNDESDDEDNNDENNQEDED